MPRTPQNWAGAGALWITAAGWAGALRRRGFASSVVTPGGPLTEEACLSQTSTASLSSRGRTSRVPAALRVLARDGQRSVEMLRYRRRAPELAEVSNANAGPIELVWQHHELFHTAGSKIAEVAGAPRIEYVHAPIVWEARRWGVERRVSGGPIIRLGEVPALRSADLVACVTEEVASEVVRLGVSSDRVLVSPMGIDPERFSPDLVPDADRMALDHLGDFVVGWVGSMRRFHALDLALEAVAIARAQGCRVGMAIAGDGQDRPRIESIVDDHGLGDAVQLLGQISNHDVPRLLASVDAAVITAGADQEFHYSPLKLREYLAMARPVAVPATGEIVRYLDDERTGMLYEPGDAVGLARVFTKLADDAVLRSTVGVA
ncbi:MAG: glycosyltransferase, partial [Ilumatobacteraceae bacterium]